LIRYLGKLTDSVAHSVVMPCRATRSSLGSLLGLMRGEYAQLWSRSRLQRAFGRSMGEAGGRRRNTRGRPRQAPWSERELCEFQSGIRRLLETLGYSPEELDVALGYSPRGCMTRQILRGRPPSGPYAEKLRRLEADPPPSKPEWVPRAPKILTGEGLPAFMAEAGPRECVGCLALQAEGEEVEQLHFFAGHPRHKVHSRCRDAWWRRRRWFRTCAELECPYLTILLGDRLPICESRDGWGLRRKPCHDHRQTDSLHQEVFQALPSGDSQSAPQTRLRLGIA